MLSLILTIISFKLVYDANRYIKSNLINIERDEQGNIKIANPKAGFFSRLKQKIIAILTHIAQKKEAKILLKKKTIAKKNVEKAPQIKEQPLSYISYLLGKYEEFVKKDLTLMIQEANNFLRNLRQRILNSSDSNLDKFSIEFQEVTQIYHNSETMIKQVLGKCSQYKQIINEQKPITSQNQIAQSQLDKIVEQLEKGHKIVNLQNNKDYKFVENYLKEKQQNVIYRNQ